MQEETHSTGMNGHIKKSAFRDKITHCIMMILKQTKKNAKEQIRNDGSKRLERRGKEKNRKLGFNPKMSHRMFTICAQNYSVKAADFEAQQQTGRER